MSIPGSASPLFLAATGAAGYDIERSLRFNPVDGARLYRTPSSASNQKTFTVSFWAKGDFSSGEIIKYVFATSASGVGNAVFAFFYQDKFWFVDYSVSPNLSLTTTALFRDPSAWYHIVIAVDTTQATDSNRCKIYFNGELMAVTGTYCSQNANLLWNNTTTALYVGGSYDTTSSSPYAFSGYLADMHSIDAQALAPSDFGEYDDSNSWQPKKYAGTYGTNGFHLDFADNSSVAALGTDTSGNSNTFTVNNISVTAGPDNDSLRDSPVNGDPTGDTGVGGEISSNYATLSGVHNSGTNTSLSEGGLLLMSGNGSMRGAVATIAMTHKTYWETKLGNNFILTYHGIIRIDTNPVLSPLDSNAIGIDGTNFPNSACVAPGAYSTSQAVYYNGSIVYSTGAIWASDDVIGHAYDPATGNYYVWKNGVALNSGNAVATLDTSYTYAPSVFTYQSQANRASLINFGQGPFTYGNAGTNRADASYKCLCTSNIADPVIADGSTAFDTKLHTGNGSTTTGTVVPLNFSPDITWIKNRNGTQFHMLYDTVRGNSNAFNTNDDYQENTYTSSFTFGTDKFTAASGGNDQINTNNSTYVSWNWDAGSTTVTNTDGTVNSQVRANQSTGTSIVTYTGLGPVLTAGHGLNAKPELIILRARNFNADWYVGFDALGWTKHLILQTDGAAVTSSSQWNNTAPTNTVFTAGNIVSQAGNFAALCFAPVEGYSAFGSYRGNESSTNGPFVYTGFKPRWVLIRANTANWYIFDTVRGYNGGIPYLHADTSGAENAYSAYQSIDILSNGFKIRGGSSGINPAPSLPVMFAAFAEHPFKTARAR